MKIVERIVVSQLPQPVRFQELGAEIFSTIATRSALKKLIKKDRIRINGEKATTARFIKGGEVIELLEEESKNYKPFMHKLKVIFEDDWLAIVVKPKGILTSGNRFATVANCLEMNLKPSKEKDASLPHPVHRLDYDTSGLLLIGKTLSSRRHLHQMFAENLVNKTYYAVTVGKIKELNGEINTPIEDKDAKTLYCVKNSVHSPRFDALNLVELKPQTGRMHQIRKHLHSIGNPVMGDKKYTIAGWEHKGNGLYLHASGLKFIHPITEELMQFNIDLPALFLRIFNFEKSK